MFDKLNEKKNGFHVYLFSAISIIYMLILDSILSNLYTSNFDLYFKLRLLSLIPYILIIVLFGVEGLEGGALAFLFYYVIYNLCIFAKEIYRFDISFAFIILKFGLINMVNFLWLCSCAVSGLLNRFLKNKVLASCVGICLFLLFYFLFFYEIQPVDVIRK